MSCLASAYLEQAAEKRPAGSKPDTIGVSKSQAVKQPDGSFPDVSSGTESKSCFQTLWAKSALSSGRDNFRPFVLRGCEWCCAKTMLLSMHGVLVVAGKISRGRGSFDSERLRGGATGLCIP
mmetsp:Transcript_69268/g.130615  ORF Transcript_69268/g.130615 Transcript_69268/m.130615 type:complete len:122 (-) Transcript_69268:885-1250(-)